MENEAFIKTKKGRLVVVGLVLFVITIVIVVAIAMFLKGDDASQEEEFQPEVDQVSGEVIWNINEEPEIGEEMLLIGFNQMTSLGFMQSQYNAIVEAVEKYVQENYPESLRVSYMEDSFKYLDEDREKSMFNFVVDDEKKFAVELDTGGSLSEIEIKIVTDGEFVLEDN